MKNFLAGFVRMIMRQDFKFWSCFIPFKTKMFFGSKSLRFILTPPPPKGPILRATLQNNFVFPDAPWRHSALLFLKGEKWMCLNGGLKNSFQSTFLRHQPGVVFQRCHFRFGMSGKFGRFVIWGSYDLRRLILLMLANDDVSIQVPKTRDL